MRQLTYQLKQAWGSLKTKPGFVATVVTTMGTTLGALLCILTLAYLLIFKPLPYPEQQRLFMLEHDVYDASSIKNATAFTYPGLIHLYKNQDVFEQAALINYGRDVLTSLPHQPTLNVAFATPEWFGLLDAPMHLGRSFEASEALDSFNPVIVLSYQTWQQTFNGSPDILDKKLEFRGVSYKVVGVLSQDFVEPQIVASGLNTQVWLPWDYNQDVRLKERWGSISGSLTFVGKLKSEMSQQQAANILTPLVNDIWVEKVAAWDFFGKWFIKIQVKSLQAVILGDSQQTVFLLLAGVLGLVLIAFANIANLFMSRTGEQQRQLAIYAALGAKKAHLFRALLAESALLMLVSLLVGLVVAALGFKLLHTYLAPVLPRINELGMHSVTFMAALFFALTFAVLFAFISSRMINYRALNASLQSSGKGTGIQVSKGFRQSLIAAQVTIATVLVFANITLFNQAVNTITEPTGFNVDNMLEMRLSVAASERPPAEEAAASMVQLKQNLLNLPEVESISHTTSVLDGFGIWALYEVSSNTQYTPQSTGASTNYFTMMGQELLEGDHFSEADDKDRNRVMIINDVFAKRLNPNGSALGMQISSDPESEPFTIKGVVKGIKMPGSKDIPIRVYTPTPYSATVMTLKLKPGQSLSREQVVTEIKGVSSLYSLFSLKNLNEEKSRMLFTQYTTAVTTACLAFITLFLASIGLYGILSYSTQMRRFELGTRMAIGANRLAIVGLVVRENAWLVLLGIGLSIVMILALFITYQASLISFVDSSLIAVSAITLSAILSLSLFACYWPLRQYINQPAIHSLRGSD